MMKKLIVAIAIAASASLAAAQTVATSRHNMLTNNTGSTPYGGSTAIAGLDQVCVFCHAPHHTNTAFAGAPLWNRLTLTGTFTAYTSDTLQGTAAVNANSLACLSCHDGTVDVGLVYTYGSSTGGTGTAILTGGTQTVGGVFNVGKDLSNDHPVGIVYPATGDFVAKSGGAVGTLPLFGTTETVECASCHDPHGTNFGNFLRVSNAASGLCTSCHSK